MAKSKYSIGGVYWQMNDLYRSTEVEDCFLSARDGRLIVRRFGSKWQPQTLTEKMALCVSHLQESSPDIEACNLVSVDGFVMVWTMPGHDTELIVSQVAVMMSLSAQFAQVFGKTGLDSVRLSGNLADLLLIPIEDIAILMIMLEGNTVSNSTQLKIREVVGQLSELL